MKELRPVESIAARADALPVGAPGETKSAVADLYQCVTAQMLLFAS